MKTERIWNTRLNRRWLKRLSVKDQQDYTLVPFIAYLSGNRRRKIAKDFILRTFSQKTDREQRRMLVVMMSMPDPNTAVIAVQNMPDDHDERVELAETMILAWSTDHTWVTVPPLQIADVTTKKNAYKAAKGAARRPTWVAMNNAINGVMFLYQSAANDNKLRAIEIIQSGKFHVRGKGGNTSQIWGLEKSEIAGEILLTGVAVDDVNRVYNWWYSKDGITWVRMAGTHYSHTKMSGLVPGDIPWFRYELFLDDVPQGMSTELKIQVPA